MATQPQRGVRPLRRFSGGPIAPAYFPEAASQTFKAGEAVYLDSGQVKELTASADSGSQRFLGFAASDATGTTNNRIGVWLLDDDTIFIASVYHGTAASAVTAVGDVTNKWPLYQDTTNSRNYVDKGDTGSQIDCCRIVGIWANESEEEAVGDQYGQLLFIIDAAARQLAQ